ncbi:MAG: hypothetical protein AABX54_04565 [Nanoarchaeota archaeon]
MTDIKKYELRLKENIERVKFEPVSTDYRTFYLSTHANYNEPGEFDFNLNCPLRWASLALYHNSGAIILLDCAEHFQEISITGTKKAIKDAWASLELLTQYELTEVRRDTLRVAS